MRLDINSLIQWVALSKDGHDDDIIGIVTKKAARGYWVLWGDGTHTVLRKDLIKYVKVL